MTQRKGPHTPGQARPTEAPQVQAAHPLNAVPEALQEVALIDGPTSAATGQVSLSTWHELVRTQDAPQPVIRGTRCTRWRLIDVRDYWARRAKAGTPEAAERLMERSRKGTAAAQAQRAAKAVPA